MTDSPLLWVETHHRSPDQLGLRCSAFGLNYVIISGPKGGKCILSSSGAAYIGPFHMSTIDAAKVIAEADYASRKIEMSK